MPVFDLDSPSPETGIRCMTSYAGKYTIQNLQFEMHMVLILTPPYGYALFLKNEEICGWSLRRN